MTIIDEPAVQRNAQHKPAPGFWQRLLAFLLDMIFLSAALVPLEVMRSTETSVPLWPACLAQVIILFAWFYLSWTSPMQGTLMMRWCGVCLRGTNGNDPPYPPYLLLRWVVMFAPLLLLMPICVSPMVKLTALAWFPLLFISCLFNKERRGLHDLAGHCRVVCSEQYPLQTPKWFDSERENIEARLARLQSLHATWAITDVELVEQRQRILNSI